MATETNPDDRGEEAVKNQTAPKTLLIAAIVGVLIVIAITGFVLTHNHGGTSAGMTGQAADKAAGPQLGAEGPANGRSMPAAMGTGTQATGQGGGSGAKGSGIGAGGGTSGTAATRTGGASGGAPAGPSAGAPGTAP